LPDLRGRIPVGKGTNADVNAFNKNEGLVVGSRSPKHSHSHTLTLPNHGHAVSDPGHGHTFTPGTAAGGSNTLRSAGTTLTSFGAGTAANPVANAGTGISVGNPTSNPAISGGVGSGSAVDSPSFVVVNWIIKL
jgi:hypothetical protein